MTLGQLFPTFHKVLHARLEPGHWPVGTRVTADGDLVVGGVPLTRVAARYGTPVGVLDDAEVRRRCAAYRTALPWADTACTAAALPVPAVLRRFAAAGWWVTVGSAAELAAARSAAFPAARTVAHGVLPGFAGTTVVGAPGEVGDPARLRGAPGTRRPVLIRVALRPGDPGVRVDAVPGTVRRLAAEPGLRAVGLSYGPGSPDRRVSAYESAARRLLALVAAVRDQHGITLGRLHVDGGGAEYRGGAGPSPLTGSGVGPGAGPPGGEDTDGPDPLGLADRLRVALAYECRTRALAAPRLTVEPGPVLTGPAAVTLLRVLRADAGTIVVDGPPAAGPVVRLVGRVPAARRRTFAVTGSGTGSCTAPQPLTLTLPEDVRPGDLLAVPGAGAYAPTLPALVAVAAGSARLLRERPPALT